MRAAMVGGAGYMAGKRSAQGAQREAEQEARLSALESEGAPAAAPPPAPPAPAPQAGGTDIVAKLKELKELQDAGALTQDEFDAAKQKLLAG
jgi:hypothetical protein